MAYRADQFLNQSPLNVAVKHLGFLAGALSALSLLGLMIGYGNSRVARQGPTISVEVPPLPAPPKAGEAHATVPDQVNWADAPGLARLAFWRRPDGALTPFTPGSPVPALPLPDGATPAVNGETPHVTSPVEAASADPALANGTARVLTPPMGGTNIENGVAVTRGGATAGLARAPFPGLTANSPNGPLPVIAPDGRTAFAAYRRPFTDAPGPKIAIVVAGLGLNARMTQRAIQELPPNVTLSFVPYADNLQGWIDAARASGKEVMIEVPMEPLDYPENDPGPHTLLASAPADENARRLEFLLGRGTGYFAVTNYLGARFASSGDASGRVMGALKNRGLGFLSDGSASGLLASARASGARTAAANRSIDISPSSADIAAQLGALEAQARQSGSAIGFGVGYNVTIDSVLTWTRSLQQRGIILAPASALMH